MHAGSPGQTWGDGSQAVFSHGRVRLVTLPGSISTAPEADPVHLGHPHLLLPTLHTHPLQHRGPRRPDDGGVQGSVRRLEENSVSSANGVQMSCSGSSRAQKITQTRREGARPQTHTQNTFTASFPRHHFIHTKWGTLVWVDTNSRCTKRLQATYTLHAFFLPWLLQPPRESQVAG